MMEKISVIVPCYNQAQYLPEALESVLNQTYLNWECIIVNDGSPDNTKKVADEWLKKDARFKYIEQENKGLSGARNAGIELAKGEFILPLDADDKISEDYLELAIKEFQASDPPKVVYSRAAFLGAKTGEWNLKPYSLKELAIGNMIFCSAFFRKSDWEKAGGYDENMRWGWEDWEFWISLLKNGGNVKRIDSVCFFYRVKENSMINSINRQQSKFLQNHVNIKHADLYVKLFGNFWEIKAKKEEERKAFLNALESRKQAINLLCKNTIGFKIFPTPKLPYQE